MIREIRLGEPWRFSILHIAGRFTGIRPQDGPSDQNSVLGRVRFHPPVESASRRSVSPCLRRSCKQRPEQAARMSTCSASRNFHSTARRAPCVRGPGVWIPRICSRPVPLPPAPPVFSALSPKMLYPYFAGFGFAGWIPSSGTLRIAAHSVCITTPAGIGTSFASAAAFA